MSWLNQHNILAPQSSSQAQVSFFEGSGSMVVRILCSDAEFPPSFMRGAPAFCLCLLGKAPGLAIRGNVEGMVEMCSFRGEGVGSLGVPSGLGLGLFLCPVTSSEMYERKNERKKELLFFSRELQLAPGLEGGKWDLRS